MVQKKLKITVSWGDLLGQVVYLTEEGRMEEVRDGTDKATVELTIKVHQLTEFNWFNKKAVIHPPRRKYIRDLDQYEYHWDFWVPEGKETWLGSSEDLVDKVKLRMIELRPILEAFRFKAGVTYQWTRPVWKRGGEKFLKIFLDYKP